MRVQRHSRLELCDLADLEAEEAIGRKRPGVNDRRRSGGNVCDQMPGGLAGICAGHETLRHWRLDQPTPMEHMRILDPAPDRHTIRLTYQRALDLLPALKSTKLSAAWAGYIDSTPDGVPAIGEIAALPGLILAAGFSGHGFGLGPGAGHLIADIVAGGTLIVDPRPFAPDRFFGFKVGKVAEF